MLRRWFIFILILSAAVGAARAEEIVVLTETPVAEFTLPNGKVLKNAFVWKRSSEGLMIVHDTGQYFLNYALLPPEWKQAYLGEPAEKQPKEVKVEYAVDDRYDLMRHLSNVPGLDDEVRAYLLRESADDESEKAAFALAFLQSLLSNSRDEAQRIHLLIEEKGLEIDVVADDVLFKPCEVCDEEGRKETDCAECDGSGKCDRCDGEGIRKTGIGNSTIHCTTCRGSGDCPACAGEGTKSSICRACRGRGWQISKSLCEVKRERLVSQAKAMAGIKAGGVLSDENTHLVMNTLAGIKELDPGAVRYFVSPEYTGGMDTNILIVCLMESLLKNRLDDAERYLFMIDAYFPNGDVLDIGKYLQPCEACDSSGRIEKDCRLCDGKGKCRRCEGEGERKSEFEQASIHCTTCRGTGDCGACGGDGTRAVQCSSCKGRGRIFEEERAKIKRQLMAEELNAYYRANRQY
jgi:hypothetical protein